MSRRAWWTGVALIVLALLAHALVPRYDWRPIVGVHWVRVDRWTGRATYGRFQANGAWAPIGDPRATALDAEIDQYLSSLPKK